MRCWRVTKLRPSKWPWVSGSAGSDASIPTEKAVFVFTPFSVNAWVASRTHRSANLPTDKPAASANAHNKP